MLLCSLFSYAPAHHRPLHSFPTRRSSDLSRRSVAQRLPLGRIEHGRSSGREPELAADELGPFDLAVVLQPVGDRKSTRLNSSHRCISYAVFCLKKKKI